MALRRQLSPSKKEKKMAAGIACNFKGLPLSSHAVSLRQQAAMLLILLIYPPLKSLPFLTAGACGDSVHSILGCCTQNSPR
jgi:hypothetical protein